MTTYLVSYDLRGQRNYDDLYAAIKAYTNWAHVLESDWLVVSDKTAAQVRDDLLRHLDGDDGLFVLQSAGVAAWTRVLCKNDWLKANL